MSLVYRTVPSLKTTLEKFKTINKEQENLEGILYHLGFLSFEDGYRFFKSNEDVTMNTFEMKDERYKYFFLFPNDAVMCTWGCTEPYSYDPYHFELLEYDIPREVLIEYCGYGYYKGKAHVEFAIPNKIFKEYSTTIASEILIDQLLECKDLLPTVEGERTIYKNDFVTGKRIFCRVAELYNQDGILSFQEVLSLLVEKGMNPSLISLEFYEDFQKNAYDIDHSKERELELLKKKLTKILR